MHILIVEDEKKMAGLLKRGLEEENHRVSLAFDGSTGLELAQSYEFDALILDLMLPIMDGYEVARRLRKQNNPVPILMLTARDSVPDIAHGLDTGADDYLTKPFSFVELLARLRAVTRRRPAPATSVLQLGDLAIAHWIAEAHRGIIEVESIPEQGSTFHVRLPLVAGASGTTERASARAQD
jgi:DNA-binding response OmpR family regulator